MRIRFVVAVLLLATPSVLAQPAKVEQARQLMTEAMAARESKELPLYLEKVAKAAELRPNHPGIQLRLAGALALNGKASDALGPLRRAAAMGLAHDTAADADLAPLRSKEGFGDIAAQFARNSEPAGKAAEAFTVTEKGILAEGVTFDRLSGNHYVSSVRERKIFRLSKGKVTTFADEDDGLLAPMGMAVDQKRRLLWVATSALPPMRGYDSKMEGSAAVLAFNLDSGKIETRVAAPEGKHLFGDLTIDGTGNVYVSDTLSPAIYRIKAATSSLETFHAGDPFVSPQGLTFAADQTTLYVADYSQGIVALDVKAKKAILLTSPSDATLLGIDGLYADGARLIAVQNGMSPNRVVRLTLDKGKHAVTGVEVLASNLPGFDEPTLGVIARDQFWFVANSQWGAFDDEGKVREGAELRETKVMVINLK